MSQGNTLAGSVQVPSCQVDTAVRYLERKLAAIDALAAGRFAEAQRLLLDLLAESDPPAVPGHCRFCGCSEEHGCAIAIPGDEGNGAVVARCSWWDEARTVCSKLSCIGRYEREQGRAFYERDEQGRVVRDHGDDDAPRIVLP